MDVLKPNYLIEIGSETFQPTSRCVFDVRVKLNMDAFVNEFEVFFTPTKKVFKVKRGDDVSIKLGYTDNLHDVFEGTVDDVERGFSMVRVTGFNFAFRLLNLRVNQVYENQSAGKIVSDLAGKTGIKVEDVMDGISFPIYVVDDSKNAFEHIRDLADKCGFDVFLNVNNKLVFKGYERSEPHVLEYGKNIIELEVYDYRPIYKGVTVFGESPASYKGADTFCWLTKKQVEGVAGSDMVLPIFDPTIRDKDTAESVAKNKLKVLSKSVSGVAKIIGNSEIKLGDTIEIKGAPDGSINGEFQVRGVEHVLNRVEGFITYVYWRI